MTAVRQGTRRRKVAWDDMLGKMLLVSLAVAGLLCLIVPTVIVIITSFDTRQFIGFPPAGFSFKRYAQILNSPSILESARLSAISAGVVVLIDLALGVPAAIALVRREFPGRGLLTSFLLSPIMLPGIVLGIAILFFYSAMGLRLSLPLMVASHVVFTLPFLIRLTMARMERTDPHLEEAAQILGANKWQVFRHVLFPQLKPGIYAGAAFAFLSSFDNLTVSLFTAPVRDRTLPIELFYLMRFDLDPVVSAVAAIQFVFTFVIILIIGRKLGSKGLVGEL
jgi:putative spermidine/putrescine transport system permease protein